MYRRQRNEPRHQAHKHGRCGPRGDQRFCRLSHRTERAGSVEAANDRTSAAAHASANPAADAVERPRRVAGRIARRAARAGQSAGQGWRRR